MAAIPAGCERRSALCTVVAVKVKCMTAIFKGYAANVLRCKMLLCFGGRDIGLRSFVIGQGFKKWCYYVTLCISARIDDLG